ncbi:uncharacterized protein LOC142162326 [Nicotiana tabacum]|uniref:Uncharacterized protein LOC142162326 n=1 Tax=Nicotiana tabacum TaxID=4097 RepID=A0AC58RPW2_TOBAC
MENDECLEDSNLKTEGDATNEDWFVSDSDPSMISLSALSGIQGAQIIHMTGYNNKRPLQILLDGGSTHNFIDCEYAKRLGCTISSTKGTSYTSDLIVFPVGRYDLVLGALWMKTLGPVTMDYTDLTMSFTYQVLVVEPELPSGNQFVAFIQRNSCSCYNREPSQSVQTGVCRSTSLPPQRGTFDHSIPLQPRTKPINIRPYRYSSLKKDIIKKLIKDMLQQDVIQYSNSPFASPVIDTSGIGIGVVPMQLGHPIAFISNGLAPRHVALSVYERELLALYKKGKENAVADSLSRVDGVTLMSLMAPQKHFTWINEQLRRKEKLVVGNDDIMRKKILTLWHSTPSGGHSGIDVTTKKMMAYFYWKGIRKDILDFIHSCDTCQRNKYDTSAYPGLLQPLPIPATPWTNINMDFIEGLPKSRDLDSAQATWELASDLRTRFPQFTLEDKGIVHRGGIDTHNSATEGPTSSSDAN